MFISSIYFKFIISSCIISVWLLFIHFYFPSFASTSSSLFSAPNFVMILYTTHISFHFLQAQFAVSQLILEIIDVNACYGTWLTKYWTCSYINYRFAIFLSHSNQDNIRSNVMHLLFFWDKKLQISMIHRKDCILVLYHIGNTRTVHILAATSWHRKKEKWKTKRQRERKR